MARGWIRLLAATMTVFAVGFLTACGGSNTTTGGSSNASPSATAAQGGSHGSSGETNSAGDGEKASAGASGGSGEKGQKGSGASQASGGGDEAAAQGQSGSKKKVDRAQVETPLRVSGGGSAQFRTPRGDNSIQDFGQEGGESELQQAAEALHGFLVARSAEEWARACGYLSSTVVEQLEVMAAHDERPNDKSCASGLGAITSPLPIQLRRELSIVDAASLRREGERGFLIYFDFEKSVQAILMAFEDGAWKVGGLGAVPLD